MNNMNHFTFKIATEPSEFEQIYQLNYETFVEEIPQHAKNEEQKLVDKFHDENLYFICLKGQEVIGMLCYRDKRPFSLGAGEIQRRPASEKAGMDDPPGEERRGEIKFFCEYEFKNAIGEPERGLDLRRREFRPAGHPALDRSKLGRRQASDFGMGLFHQILTGVQLDTILNGQCFHSRTVSRCTR